MMTTTQATQPEGAFCQSCAMPLRKAKDFGTEASGARNDDYCAYCYKDGAFISPNMSMEQMRDFCIDKMVERGVMPREQAAGLLYEVMPKLKRWAGAK